MIQSGLFSAIEKTIRDAMFSEYRRVEQVKELAITMGLYGMKEWHRHQSA